MKIAIFSECYKPTMNGVVISIETFRNELIKMGHQVFVIAPKPKIKGYKDEDPDILRVPSIKTPFKKDYPIGLPYFTDIPQKISKLNLDIIHLQHPFQMGKFGRKIARKNNLPVVYTYHTLLVEYAHYVPIFKNLAKKYLVRVSRNFSNSIDQIITPSLSIKKLLQSYGVTKPIEPLPTGIISKNYQKTDAADLKKELKIAPENKILLFVGRLAEEKNVSFLIKAFAQIQKKYPKCHLIFVGGGEAEAEYKKQVQDSHLEKKVSFLGMLPKEKTNQIFGKADIFMMPSLTDTQGIVVAEAFASSLPCVAMDKFGPAEVVENGKSGFLIAPGNLDQYVEKTLELLQDDELRHKMSQEAVKKAQDFDSEKTAARLIEIYQKTIKMYK